MLQVLHTEKHAPLFVHASLFVYGGNVGKALLLVCVFGSLLELCVIMLMARITSGFLCAVCLLVQRQTVPIAVLI